LGTKKLFWRTDYQIRDPSLRVIDFEGKLIGILSREEAIKRAKKIGLTLVEIAPNAKPPVAKIVDFGKFRYAEDKKARAQAKRVKGGELKEIRFSPFIAENDFNIRIERIKEFLEDKNKVKVVVVFKGPQMRVKSAGYNLIDKIKGAFGETVTTDMEPKFFGKYLVTVISPVTGKKNAEKKSQKINNK
jgi:translation initiation factor IF-3